MHIVVGKVDRVIYQVYDLGNLVVALDILLWGYYHCEFHQRAPLRGLRLH